MKTPQPNLESFPNVSLEDRVENSRQAWKRLGMSLAAITPNTLARLLLGIGTAITLVWLVFASWPALLPFVVGGVLAYIIMPLVNILDRILPRILAALFGVLFVLACIGVLVSMIVPPLISQTLTLIQQIPPESTIESLSNDLVAKVQSLPPTLREIVVNAILNTSGNLRESINTRLPTLISLNAVVRLLNAVGFILGLIVLPTWLLTVLRGQPRAKRSLDRWLPVGARADFWAIVRILDRSFGVFLRGQMLISFTVGVLTYIGLRFMTYLGAPEGSYPVTFGVIAGLLQLIPEVGPLVNTITVVLLAYRINPQLAIYILILYLGIQYLITRLLKDRLEERIIDVNPALLVLFIVALSQLGFWWLFLSAPLAGVSRDLIRYAFGRLGDPPRPAGLLPGEKLPKPVPARMAESPQKRTPMIYRRMQARTNRR